MFQTLCSSLRASSSRGDGSAAGRRFLSYRQFTEFCWQETLSLGTLVRLKARACLASRSAILADLLILSVTSYGTTNM